jgi:hypothetical protein
VSDRFIDLVSRELLPKLREFSYSVADQEQADSFDNASVVLHSPDLRIRLVRERGQVFADFGPSSEPNVWYDSAVIVEFLGLSTDGGFHDRDAHRAMEGIAGFVKSFQRELAAKFANPELSATKQALDELREVRAERLFGGS